MKRCAAIIVSVISTAVLPPVAYSQEYPFKPIRLISPFAAGGGADVLARFFAQKLSAALQQQVIVDSRAGAGSRTRAVNRDPACGM